MMTKFLYPTVKNSILVFCLLQVLPIGLNLFQGHSPQRWLGLEAVILGIVCLMPLKPLAEMDERERGIELKWKNRMLECTYPFVMFSIVLLTVKPDANGWTVLSMFTVPSFLMLVVLSVLLRRDQGGFFSEAD